MGCQDYVTHVVQGHVSINPIGEFECHDAASCIVDEDVEAIGIFGDFVCSFGRCFPICEITLKPLHFGGHVATEFFFDGVGCVVHDFFGVGDYEDFGDVFGEEGVGYSVADT